jgi:prepilin-type N-terminal cleavage/methylation domain-containing protein/prepilin-type processing-associated H-X9-DG protein
MGNVADGSFISAVRLGVGCMYRKSPQRAFTLVELLVVIGIIALLVSILLPVLHKARAAAVTKACLSNLHQIGIAIQTYTSDEKGHLIPGQWFHNSAPVPPPEPFLNDGASPGNRTIETWGSVMVHHRIIAAPMFDEETAGIDMSSPFLCSAMLMEQPSTHNMVHQDYAPYPSDSQTNVAFIPLRYWSRLNQKFYDLGYGCNGDTAYGSRNYFQRYRQPPNVNTYVKFPKTEASRAVAIFDGYFMNVTRGAAYRAAGRHGLTTNPEINILFFDGHANTYRRSELPQSGNNLGNSPEMKWRADQP